jgi:hypothetical protein
VGTIVAEGKELREFGGETYVMEHALVPEVALVKAHRADKSGNLQFRLTARNFNPAAAMAGKICVVEVEEIVEPATWCPTRCTCPAFTCTASCTTPTPRSASRSAPSRAEDRSLIMAWTQDQMAGVLPAGTGRRFLRELRHWHPHPGGQLCASRQGSLAAKRKRHVGHRPFSRPKGRWMPT